MVENLANDYLHRPRACSGRRRYTGIKSIVAQDLAVAQDQGGGPIADRSREYLVSSDRAIIALRKRLLDRGARRCRTGSSRPRRATREAYGVRPGDFMLPRDVPVAEGAKDILLLK